MSQGTIAGIIPTEKVTDVSTATQEYINKMSSSASNWFGKTKEKICQKEGFVCFDKKKLLIAIIVLIVIVIILSLSAFYLAYEMGKKYMNASNEETMMLEQNNNYMERYY